MNVLAFASFVIAAVLALLAAAGTALTGNDYGWAAFFGFLGLALAYLPPVRRGP